MRTNGTGFTDLHDFDVSDGITPVGGLVTSGSTLYGTTQDAGPGGFGTVFRVDIDGSNFSVLHAFGPHPDGHTPVGGLVCLGGVLYGATSFGGEIGEGVVFSVDLDGSNYSKIINFNDITSNTGALPSGPLISLGNSVLGATSSGGNFGGGTVFSASIDGLNYASLYDFTLGDTNDINKDGLRPSGPLLLSGDTLYGVTLGGGPSGKGTIFSISLAPEIKLMPSTSGLVISWPTNVAGLDYGDFSLESATNLVSPVWTAVSLTSAIVNGNNVVTNPMSGAQVFFRLASH